MMTQQCQRCAKLLGIRRCKDYPEEIPEKIFTGKKRHDGYKKSKHGSPLATIAANRKARADELKQKAESNA